MESHTDADAPVTLADHEDVLRSISSSLNGAAAREEYMRRHRLRYEVGGRLVQDAQDECRCPVRPYYTMGSLASGSAHETALVRRWEEEHGEHVYAKARDELARALQYAQGAVRSGNAVLDMVADVYSTVRRTEADRMSDGV